MARYSFVGFGGGTHSCMGESFAYMQIKTILRCGWWGRRSRMRVAEPEACCNAELNCFADAAQSHASAPVCGRQFGPRVF
jgi:hypothetical protein